MAFCSKCGTNIPEGAGFCPACGNAAGNTGGNTLMATNQTSGMPSNIGGMLSYIVIYWPLRLLSLAVMVFLMFKAYNNEKYKLPVIGDLAEKQM